MSSAQLLTLLAAILGATGVAAGAFGAHGLESSLEPDKLEIWNKAARYQMYHALALLGTAALTATSIAPASQLQFVGWWFLAGVIFFSGSLYLLAVTDISWLGAITPLGGICMLVGWGFLFRAAL